MANPFETLFSRRNRRLAKVRPPRRVASLAPAVVLAAGAGAALWWWTQWARGATEDADGASAAEGAPNLSPVLEPQAEATLNETLAVQADTAPSAGVGAL